MNMMDELTEKFALELDVPLGGCTEYNETSKEIHDFAKRELSESKAEELEKLIGRYSTIVADEAGRAGLRLGARIVAALLGE